MNTLLSFWEIIGHILRGIQDGHDVYEGFGLVGLCVFFGVLLLKFIVSNTPALQPLKITPYSWEAIYTYRIHRLNTTPYAPLLNKCCHMLTLKRNRKDYKELKEVMNIGKTPVRTVCITSNYSRITRDVDWLKNYTQSQNHCSGLILFISQVYANDLPDFTEFNIDYGINVETLPKNIRVMSMRELFILSTQ